MKPISKYKLTRHTIALAAILMLDAIVGSIVGYWEWSIYHLLFLVWILLSAIIDLKINNKK